MVLVAKRSVPNHEYSAPGAFLSEEAGLPRHEHVFGEGGRLRDIDLPRTRQESNSGAMSAIELMKKEKTRGRLEEEEWLQQLADLEAQPVNEAAEKPARTLCMVTYRVLTQQQRERMDEAEVLDILEKGELVCVERVKTLE